ncbi:MAG: hypothetical protein ACK57N_07360 [Planctomycetia bacterium]|jgi:hypothetical protein
MDRAAALEKVKLPAVGLIVVGALGAASALLGAVQGATNEQVDQLRQAFDQAGIDPGTTENLVSALAGGNLVMSLLALAISALVLWSGLQMRQLKGRGLAIAGAILAMIPCFTGCCCVIGLPVGIWALVVLMNAEVKAAFDAGAQ